MKNKRKILAKIISTFSVVLLVLVLSISSSFSVNAAADGPKPYYIYNDRPTVTERSGYIEVLCYSKSQDAWFVYVFYWNINAKEDDTIYRGSTKLNIYKDKIEIDLAYGEFLPIMVFKADGTTRPNYVYPDDKGLVTYEFWSDYQCVAYNINGSYYNLSEKEDLGSEYAHKFVVFYGSEIKIFEMLNYINDNIYEGIIQNDEQIDLLEDLLKSSKNIEDKLDDLEDLLEQMTQDIDEETKDKSEDIQNSANEKGDKLDSLNEQNKTEKIDVDNASSSVDSNIDANSISNFGSVLSVFTNDNNILKMIMTVLSVSLVAYVLFGKR